MCSALALIAILSPRARGSCEQVWLSCCPRRLPRRRATSLGATPGPGLCIMRQAFLSKFVQVSAEKRPAMSGSKLAPLLLKVGMITQALLRRRACARRERRRACVFPRRFVRSLVQLRYGMVFQTQLRWCSVGFGTCLAQGLERAGDHYSTPIWLRCAYPDMAPAWRRAWSWPGTIIVPQSS